MFSNISTSATFFGIVYSISEIEERKLGNVNTDQTEFNEFERLAFYLIRKNPIIFLTFRK
jgi:hypothetical protein